VFERIRGIDWAAILPALAILAVIAVGLQLDGYSQYVTAITVISAMIGAGLTLLVGFARCITLASGAVMAIGAYASTLLAVHYQVPFPAAAAAAIVCGALTGWVIALPGTRFRGHNLAMVTLVFQSVAIILLREAKSWTGGAEGIHVPVPVVFGWKVDGDAGFLALIGGSALIAILLVTIVARGAFGKNLRAVAVNEVAAEAFGVSVPGYLTAAFVISSAMIGFAGALAAPRIRILDPDSFGIVQSIFMLAYPIVGGMASVWGGLIGGGGLRVLPELLRPVADYQELILCILVVVVVMFFPGGAFELFRRLGGMIAQGRTRIAAHAVPVHAAPRSEPPAAIQAASLTPLLSVSNVNKSFDALRAVADASLQVPRGGIHGLIGPNGAGKTSLFNVISGFLAPDSGSVQFDGKELLTLRARDRIGLGITRTFQHVATFGHLSCVENVVVGLGQNGVLSSLRQSFGAFAGDNASQQANARALAALDAVGLVVKAGSPAGSLSLGDQRRLEIARAIVSEPQLILLDEPVSGVSKEEAEALRRLLLRINEERGVAMLIVEHNIPFVAGLCRSLSVMGQGRIVANGRPDQVISDPSVRQLYFGEERAA
jgi:ABC-type branched-subunit amino acid transport system ATPase component/ABC-type branched-subunit amino acid transport system permease subunit